MTLLRQVTYLLWIVCLFMTISSFAYHHHHYVHHYYHHRRIVPSLPAITQPVSIATTYSPEALSHELSHLMALGGGGANMGVMVKSMQKGDLVYNVRSQNAFTPASTLKILTAEAALLYLGPSYRFSTQLLTDAKTIKNGILQGNLYIILSGDPTLTYDDLVGLIQTLKSRQIYAIAGNVYIDETAYDQDFYGPGWEGKDKGYCYAAPISAGIINHNCIPLQVTPAKIVGRSAQVSTSPKFFYPPIKNSVVTHARARACALHLSTDPSKMLAIDGCVGRAQPAGVSFVINDVPEYNRQLFNSLLSRVSIKVGGNVTFGTAPSKLVLMGQHISDPLPLLIKTMLKKSDNVIAEALFKKLGQLYSHQPGSWQNGSEAVKEILMKYMGMNITGMRILDGSGLSADNLVTPAQLMRTLDFAYHNTSTANDFMQALPIAGVDGTLKNRMSNIARRVHAKTGTISGVVALAGYVTTYKNETLAFVIMINGNKDDGWRYKGLEDQMATAMVKFTR